MKYLLTAIVALCLLVCVPSAASAKEDKLWSKGETIITATICMSEESILKIVKADTISEEEVLARMYALTRLSHCVSLPTPLPFYVLELLVEYRDFRQIDTVVLSVAKVDKPNRHVGFVLAEGKYGKDKGI
jgi:hypothetical protein